MLIVQTFLTQWDKSQRSEADIRARLSQPHRALVDIASANRVDSERIVLDTHGEPEQKSRIQFHLDNDDFYVDRFHFSLSDKTLEYKTVQASPKLISGFNKGWVQCRYNWRRRVEQNGYIFWLYEDITLNACFVEEFQQDVFMNEAAEHVFTDLTLAEE